VRAHTNTLFPLFLPSPCLLSNPDGARFSAPVQTSPEAHPASCTMRTGSFPGLKSGRGVTLTPHPLLVPWSWKSRTIPLLPLWAVRPVQSLSACTRVTFTFSLQFWISSLCTSLNSLFLFYVLLVPNIVFCAIFWNVLSLWFSLNVRDQDSYPCKNNKQDYRVFLTTLTLRRLMSYIYIWSTHSWCF